jgi:UDP-glucose 4-epimerase
VTGGAGFVGSTTAQRLIEAGHQITVLDSMVRGHEAAVPKTARLVKGDIGDASLVEQTLRNDGIEAVLHCAGLTQVGESVQQPDTYFQANVVASLTMLDAMRSAGVKRIAFSSSAAVYGAPEKTPIDESQPMRPVNPYGETKRAFEGILDAYARAYEMAAVSLRYFNVAGATHDRGEDHEQETHLIPNILKAVTGGAPLKVFGTDYPTRDGTCVRDYIHIDDLADAHLAALQLTAQVTGSHVACNLGSGSGFTVTEVLAAAEKVVGQEVPHTLAGRREGDPPVLVASNQKAQELLGWTPKRGTLEEMIGSAWAWRQRHPNGYEE